MKFGRILSELPCCERLKFIQRFNMKLNNRIGKARMNDHFRNAAIATIGSRKRQQTEKRRP